MKGKFRDLLLIIFLLNINALIAQSYSLLNLQFPHTSDQSYISDIFQDSRGFIWIGTSENGLYRYDGYNYLEFRHSEIDKNSLSSNQILCIAEDSQNNIWIGTRNGLNKYLTETNSFKTFTYSHNDPNSISNNIITRIFIDSKGDMWIATDGGGINHFNPKNESFSATRHEAGDSRSISSDYVMDIVEETPNIFWIATWEGGLNRFDLDKWIFEKIEPSVEASPDMQIQYIRCLEIDSNKCLWIGTVENGIVCYNTKEKSFQAVDKMLEKNSGLDFLSISNIVIDQNNIWVATMNAGLFRLKQNGEIIKHYDTRSDPGIMNNYSSSILKDRSGVIWTGCWGNNIHTIIPDLPKIKLIDLYRDVDSLKTFSNELTEVNNEVLWVAKGEEGMLSFNIKTGKRSNFNNFPKARTSKKLNTVSALTKDSKGIIWLGLVYGGLHKFNPNKLKIAESFFQSNDEASIPNNSVNSIYVDSDSVLYVGTQGGLCRVNLIEKSFKTYLSSHTDEKSLTDNYITCIIKESDDELWIGTIGGICRFDKTTEESETIFKNKLTNNYVVCMAKDTKGMLWVGTTGGLNMINLKENSIRHFYKAGGMPSNFIESLLPDSFGNVWVGTRKGLVKMNLDKNITRIYNEQDNLWHSSFNKGAIQGSNGNLYFSGTGGIYYFNPADIKINEILPIPGIIKVNIVNDTEKSGYRVVHNVIDNKLVLHPGENSVIFELSSFDYRQVIKNKFIYMIPKLHDKWQSVGSGNKLMLDNLKPGKYKLKLLGTNNDGISNTSPVEVSIIVEKSIYQKVWVYAAILVLILLIIALAIRERIKTWIYLRKMPKNVEVNDRIEKLKNLMEEEKLYTKSDLTITEIASNLGISENLLSSTLNKFMKKNFYDFVNEYRVEEAKKLLVDPKYKNIKVVFIAYDSGFNSKATFYVVFKKATKMTPTEYRKRFFKE